MVLCIARVVTLPLLGIRHIPSQLCRHSFDNCLKDANLSHDPHVPASRQQAC